MKKTAILTGLLLLNYGQADELTQRTDNGFKLSIGGYFITNGDTQSNISSLEIAGEEIRFEKNLNMDDTANSFRINGEYRFGDLHRVEFAYYSLDSSGLNHFSKDIPFLGETYQANVDMDAHLDTNVYKINYAYSFYKDERTDIAAAIGLHMMDMDLKAGGRLDLGIMKVDIPAVSAYDIFAPLPVVGLRGKYTIMPKLDIYASVDYFGIDFGDYGGSLSDFGIGIEYQVFENFGLGVGWNATNTDLEIDDDGELYLINQNISGVLAYLSYSF